MIPQVSPGPLGDDIMDALVQFHVTYGCPIRPVPVAHPDEHDLRISLLREEFSEYVSAAEQDDVVEVADALADMVYVIFGTALSYGIDLPAVLAEVHRSNMSKVGEDGLAVLREDGKVMKGPNYFRPDIAAVLADQARIQFATVVAGGSTPNPPEATNGNASSCACGTSTVGTYRDGGKHRADVCGWGEAAHNAPRCLSCGGVTGHLYADCTPSGSAHEVPSA